MKRLTTILGILLISTAVLAQNSQSTVPAQDTQDARQDSTLIALKIKELNTRKEALAKQIKAEDAKRNRAVQGVSPETQERLDDKQDSICLALRSQLVAVNLELKELVPDRTTSSIVNYFNDLMKPEEEENREDKE
ncbi:MAG: hypothetical protein ACI3Z0_07710 [Candidatus Cryptobacteroides sp.]